MPPKNKPQGLAISDLLSAEAGRMSQAELRRFRAALADLLPAAITQAAELARAGNKTNQ